MSSAHFIPSTARDASYNTTALAMVTAIANFIQPMIYERTNTIAEYRENASQLAYGREGQQLVSAMANFITTALNAHMGIDNQQDDSGGSPAFALHEQNQALSGYTGVYIVPPSSENSPKIPHATTQKYTVGEAPFERPKSAHQFRDISRAKTPLLEVPTRMRSAELDVMTHTMATAHVFNKMPIRLLAFDAKGEGIHLIERSKILSWILPNIYTEIQTPAFQADWAKAERLRDVKFGTQYRQDEMTRLLKGVMERGGRYAILSHTWIRDQPGDVVYQDWDRRMHNQRGYSKITNFCIVAARRHRVTLGWVDTICINKASSTELDESIRSMYHWYRGACVCITYLSETVHIEDQRRDSWFTRGWTLQELLAAKLSYFYNMYWLALGSSEDVEIERFLQGAMTITKTELRLCRNGDVEMIPLSRRMQLASGRQVTREEDTSYSLMGILGVDISVAYGEGSERAFRRLFRELLNSKKHILDLFNRRYDDSNTLIPSSPNLYAARRPNFDLQYGGTTLDQYQPRKPIIVTHLGVRMPFILCPGLLTEEATNLGYVPCGDLSGIYACTFAIPNQLDKVYYYNLLDRRLYMSDPGVLPKIKDKDVRAERISMFGIINFGVDNTGNILLPKSCLALKLSWSTLAQGHTTISISDPVNIDSGNTALLQLKSQKMNFIIPKDDLAQHGLQLVTLYL